jgi:hypothetical protein
VVTRLTVELGTFQERSALNQVNDDDHHEGRPRMRTFTRTLLDRINGYTLWAFNPQPELTSRYDRAA